MNVKALQAENERLRAALETHLVVVADRDAQLADRDAQLDARQVELQAALREIEQLQAKNEELYRLAFGPKSERRVDEVAAEPNGKQGWLWLADIAAEIERLAEATGAQTQVQAHARKKSQPRRRSQFPEHLHHVETTIELPEDQRMCCGEPMRGIGKQTRCELERVDVTLVHEIHRHKYACPHCQEGVRIAPAPPRPIDRGILGTSFLAWLLNERFGNHQPYHRLEKKLAAEGLDLSRVVLCESALRCAELLEPIWEELRREILASPVIHTDDTGVKLQSASNREDRTARIWVYLNREGRTVYDFTETKSRDGPESFLAGYTGFVQADAASNFDGLYVPGGATEVACWAHARRYFTKAESSDRELAKDAIDQIRELFLLERELGELPDDERQKLREEHARPRLEKFRAWLDLTQTKVLPKSPMGRAIQYCNNQWAALVRYVEDGRLAIDNNAAERALRAVAVGRKNWMHVGNQRGGDAAAILYSLVMTCREAGVPPVEYFRDVLVRLSECQDVTKLTPHGWKEHFLEQVISRRKAFVAKYFGIEDTEAAATV